MVKVLIIKNNNKKINKITLNIRIQLNKVAQISKLMQITLLKDQTLWLNKLKNRIKPKKK